MRERQTPGLQWYSLKTQNLFNSVQSVNWLEIDLKKRTVDLLYDKDSLRTTSAFAKSNNALAAINAGFFNMKQGGSVTFLKKDGAVIAKNQADLKDKNSVVIRGSFVVFQDGNVQIQSPKEEEVYAKEASIDDVLLSGPLLIEYNDPIALDETPFHQKRHPRSCACLNNKGRLLLLTVDGRSEKAEGMSLPELTEFLEFLNCDFAINLDGGGSTTLYLKGKAYSGVINYPSDNRTFDHQGQRKVANVIVVH
ncbi:MAG: phosphodiester glycosidase family protein [Bacteroidota bacterium]